MAPSASSTGVFNVLDACQSAGRVPVDVGRIKCDVPPSIAFADRPYGTRTQASPTHRLAGRVSSSFRSYPSRGSVRGGEPRVGESRNAGVSSRASSRATASRVERAVLENWRRRC